MSEAFESARHRLALEFALHVLPIFVASSERGMDLSAALDVARTLPYGDPLRRAIASRIDRWTHELQASAEPEAASAAICAGLALSSAVEGELRMAARFARTASWHAGRWQAELRFQEGRLSTFLVGGEQALMMPVRAHVRRLAH